MNIEIWSDYVCPFCYIGTRRLELALGNFPQHDEVKIEFKSFQLEPHAPIYDGQDYYESLAKKFGSIERVKQMTKQVGNMAQQVGLHFQFDKMKPTNTFTAHRLAKYATNKGENVTITKLLFEAHFINSKDISDVGVLTNLATEIGLAKDEIETLLLDETKYTNEVEFDLAEAKKFNITGVPFFVFNRKLAVSGAQEIHVFEQALQQVQSDR